MGAVLDLYAVDVRVPCWVYGDVGHQCRFHRQISVTNTLVEAPRLVNIAPLISPGVRVFAYGETRELAAVTRVDNVRPTASFHSQLTNVSTTPDTPRCPRAVALYRFMDKLSVQPIKRHEVWYVSFRSNFEPYSS